MCNEYVEPANTTVKDLAAAVHFLITAMPSWRVRGRGHMDWFGKSIDGCMSAPTNLILRCKAVVRGRAWTGANIRSASSTLGWWCLRCQPSSRA